MYQKVLNIGSWVLSAAVLLSLLGFAKAKQNAMLCQDIDINIEQHKNSRFIEEEDIRRLLSNMDCRPDLPLQDMKLEEIELRLLEHPSIHQAEVYTTLNGKLKVRISERRPIVRIYSTNGESYYLDDLGSLMPLSSKYTARTLIVNGHINIPYDAVLQLENIDQNIGRRFTRENTTAMENTILAKRFRLLDSIPGAMQVQAIYEVASYIHSHPFWKAQITQIYVDEKGELELIPRVGKHRILLGQPKDVSTKFDKLMVLYRKGLQKTGWNEYSVINLKYKNQVVCTKR